MKFNIQGNTRDLNRFRNKMLRLRNFGSKDFIRVAQDVAALSVRYAQGRVPVLTGDLKRSIHSKRDGKTVYIAAEMDYAGVVEFGSTKKNRPPKPYFYNSIRDALKLVKGKMDVEFKKIKNT